MAEQQAQRRLAAILAIDVVGYSRLMGEDESATLEQLKAHRKELIEPTIDENHGRIVKLMGDGALVEFASVVNAIDCAIAIQKGMTDRNVGVADERRMVFRIGINVGDIMVEGDDLYGDGVNVAARIQALALPGGICISRSVRDQIRDRRTYDLEDLGEVEVKNIARPVRVFRVVIDPREIAKGPPQGSNARKARPWLTAAVGAAFVLVVSVGMIRWLISSPEVERASIDRMAFALPDRPSIVVLPIENLTGDAGQEHIADGITETIISTLSRIPDLFVTDRSSSLTYKGTAIKVQQVAEELGVRYVLQGTLQRAGARIRINAQLVDALTGEHLWSQSYDRQFKDLFQLQDEIALRTTIALQVKLTTGEEARMLSRTTDNVRAWILYQQALAKFFLFTAEGNRQARETAQKALMEDPDFADALIIIGFTHLTDARQSHISDQGKSLRLAKEYADRARTIAPDAPNLFNLMQSIYRYEGSFDAAVAAGERAIALSPNSAISLLATAMTTHQTGDYDRSIELSQRAVRHNPHHRSTGLIWLSRSLWFKKDYKGAIAAAREGLKGAESPFVAAAHLLNLAVALVETGELDEARKAIDDAEKKAPQTSLSFLHSALPYRQEADWQRFATALRAAGLPE